MIVNFGLKIVIKKILIKEPVKLDKDAIGVKNSVSFETNTIIPDEVKNKVEKYTHLLQKFN